jgi:hypothetical protein
MNRLCWNMINDSCENCQKAPKSLEIGQLYSLDHGHRSSPALTILQSILIQWLTILKYANDSTNVFLTSYLQASPYFAETTKDMNINMAQTGKTYTGTDSKIE